MPRFPSLSRSDTATSALKLFVWGAKLGTLGGWVEIAACAADLIGNVKALDKAIGDMGLSPLAVALDDIRKDAARALRSGHGLQPQKIADAEALFDQTALSAFPSSARLMELGLDPAQVLEEMLYAARQNRDFRDTPMAEAFFKLVLSKALEKLLSNKTYLEKLGPDFQRQTLANDAKTHDDLAELKAMVSALRPTAQAGGLSEETLLTLARRVNADVADPDTARRELERAVEIAANVIAVGLRGSNIDEVLKRLAALTAEGNLTDARAEATKAVDDARDGADKARARHLRLLDAMIEQDTLARDADAVCKRIVEKVELDHPDPAARFDAIRSIFIEWYERGRDKGLAFDLEVSIQLARHSHDISINSDQAGTALNDLGIALWTLGDRDSGTARLEQAVTAFRAALKNRARNRVPLDWAGTQMNLGNALVALGERETRTARLEEAVVAYRATLQVWTRSRVPFDWAKAQMNLGCALVILASRGTGTVRLEEAVAAFRASLKVRSRDRVPHDWAMTQVNLGSALAALGQFDAGNERLWDAVKAFRAALEELTRDRVPLDWASTQMNIGSVLDKLSLRNGDSALRDEAAAAYRAALNEWTIDHVPLDWAKATGRLAIVDILIAGDADDFAQGQIALIKLKHAERTLREGGNISWAEDFAEAIPVAEALISTLSE
jgi:tetratricopeptide (TPR) repeat protein